MHLTYVSFSYLSKVNLGGKAVHWMRTLSQDSYSRNEPMHYAHLFPLLVLPISLTGLYKVMKKMEKKCKNTGEPMPNFFLVLDFVIFYPHAFLKKRRGYCNRLRPSVRPSVTLFSPKPLDEVQPNLVCGLLT